jgi:hypothetical protein
MKKYNKSDIVRLLKDSFDFLKKAPIGTAIRFGIITINQGITNVDYDNIDIIVNLHEINSYNIIEKWNMDYHKANELIDLIIDSYTKYTFDVSPFHGYLSDEARRRIVESFVSSIVKE